MAHYDITFYSETLARAVSFDLLLPNDLGAQMIKDNPHYSRPVKTVFLLHGYTGNSKGWLYGSAIEEYSVKYNLAVVLPNGENSFYVDSGGNLNAFGTLIGEELPDYLQKTFNLAADSEDTFIGGMSMGGFGALRLGLRYPERFGKIAALSSALIIHNIKNTASAEELREKGGSYEYFRAVFGDLFKLEESDKNPEYLIRCLQEEGKEIPALYLCCGTEDFLIEENRVFKCFLEEREVPFTYTEGVGAHDWNYWNQHLEPAIKFFLA